MSEQKTVRERIEYASQYFTQIHGVVLTTFNLNGDFLETNALPSVFGIEGAGAGRKAELHNQLSQSPCTVFYDPTSYPDISGEYRFVAQPVPLPGRFFHPKLVIITGISEEETTWVYLAVSSANLTLSGWGRNAEAFAEAWIHTRKQKELWGPLHKLLVWLETYCGLNEKHGAIAQVKKALNDMPDRRRFNRDHEQPWANSLYARLYVSPVHTQGLSAFLRTGWSRQPDKLWVYSPYWSNVSENIESFEAKRTTLVPSLSASGKSTGLTETQFAELSDSTIVGRNKSDNGDRFWHLKAYWLCSGKQTRTAVGSCNFTSAGLIGGDIGNVEAMLVFDDKDVDWLPDDEEQLSKSALATESEAEEGVPEPVPVAIVVVWDWESQSWRWWIKPSRGQTEFELHLPNMKPFAISPPGGEKSGKQPIGGAKFTVFFSAGGKRKKWQGQVVELNLVHSRRIYGKPLSATEILESWRSGSPPGEGKNRSSKGSEGEDDDDIEYEPPAAFDAVNLYDLYRSTRALRQRLKQQANPSIQRSFLVGRADSAMSLAYLADREQEAPVIRYLILREIHGIVSSWSCLFEHDEIAVVERAAEIANRAREKVRQDLEKELGTSNKRSSDRMLEWFEDRLSKLDATTHESV